MMKTALHLHLYYMDQLHEIISKLQNLDKAGIDYDLYVTMTAKDEEAETKIKQAFPKATIWQVENRGYDIGPFIDFLHKINLDSYAYILKVHTKNKKGGDYGCFNGVRIDSKTWANMLWDALLGSLDVVKNNYSILSENPQIGMVGSSFSLTDEEWTYKMLEKRINQEAQKILLPNINTISFIAGTMFMVRAQLMKPFLAYRITDFEKVQSKVHDYMLAHCLERLFGVAVLAQGYEIRGVTYKQYQFSRLWASVKRFAVQKKITKNGKKIIKICKIPVWQSKEILPTHKIEQEFQKNPSQKRRLAVYAAYDADGFVDKADIYYIRALQEIADNIIYIADNELIAGEAEKISKEVNYIKAEKHGEYDFGSYKRGFMYAKEHGLLDDIDELILCNDSCYAPIHPFKPIFDKMQNEQIDFWGITENIEIARHIQSYFMVFRPQVFKAKVFENFLASVKPQKKVRDVIENYEIGLSQTLIKAQFKCKAYIPYPERYPLPIKGATNLTACPIWMINQGSPIVKKKSFQEKISNEEGFFKLKKVIQSVNPSIAEIISLRKVYQALIKDYQKRLQRFFYQKKHTKSGKTIIKICKLPIYSKRCINE